MILANNSFWFYVKSHEVQIYRLVFDEELGWIRKPAVGAASSNRDTSAADNFLKDYMPNYEEQLLKPSDIDIPDYDDYYYNPFPMLYENMINNKKGGIILSNFFDKI